MNLRFPDGGTVTAGISKDGKLTSFPARKAPAGRSHRVGIDKGNEGFIRMAPVSFPLASGGLERYVQELRWVEFIADRDFVIVELTEEEEKRLAGCPFTPADQTDET